MSTNKVSNFKSTLEIIGLVAVLLGLVFVGIEVRQNTAAVQAQTLQGLDDSSQEFLLLLASDAELVEIQQRAHKDPDSLNEIEELRYTFLERTRWLRSQNAFFQHQRGARRCRLGNIRASALYETTIILAVAQNCPG